jgi:hypothetical protein
MFNDRLLLVGSPGGLPDRTRSERGLTRHLGGAFASGPHDRADLRVKRKFNRIDILSATHGLRETL